jgi:hypothetical protein
MAWLVILHVDTERAKAWSEQEVIDRWERLFSLPVIVKTGRLDYLGCFSSGLLVASGLLPLFGYVWVTHNGAFRVTHTFYSTN